MYVSTIGEYWRSLCTSACSCAIILSTTSVKGVCCWAAAASGIAPSARTKIFKLRIVPPKFARERYRPSLQVTLQKVDCHLYVGSV